MTSTEIPPAERLFTRIWDRVDTSGQCWLYRGGSHIKGGYRLAFSHSEGKRLILRLVHRAVWEVINGPIPKGMESRHLCSTPDCVRPDHLSIGTRTENEHDKDPYRLPWDRRLTSKTLTGVSRRSQNPGSPGPSRAERSTAG